MICKRKHQIGPIIRLVCLALCLCSITPLVSCSGKQTTHTCVFDRQIIDEMYLKTPGSCMTENIYYLSCACGASGSEDDLFSSGMVDHDFSGMSTDKKYLCSEATEEASATYYKSCIYCGLKGDETFSHGDRLPKFRNRKIIIFGDSYSTFSGVIPPGYSTWYPNLDVKLFRETWWSLFLNKTDSKIVRNDSWSGSTIGYTGYSGSDTSKTSSFIYRYRKLKSEGFFESNTIDTVFVFGGTNDSWADAPLGEAMYSDWQEDDLYKVLPAICYFAHTLKADLPDAKIVFIINNGLKPEIQNCMIEASEHYGLDYLLLKNVAKSNNHPTKKGMEAICNQLFELLNT